jgi:hypothetical protein
MTDTEYDALMAEARKQAAANRHATLASLAVHKPAGWAACWNERK